MNVNKSGIWISTISMLIFISLNAHAVVTWNGDRGINARIVQPYDCTECHTAADLQTRDGFSENNVAMPPSGTPLPQSLRDLFDQFAEDDHPITAAPTVTPPTFSSVGKYSFTARSTLNENGTESRLTFQYRISGSGGAYTTAPGERSGSGSGGGGVSSNVSLSLAITGLRCGTTYEVRARASGFGVTESEPESRTTSACNAAPSITSTAPTIATEEQGYEYQLLVSDANDVTFSYELQDEPTGMGISSTGLIRWTPQEGVTSSGEVTVLVRDGGEDGVGPARQRFTINVNQINDEPVLAPIGSAGLRATEGLRYTYQPIVTDVDDSAFSWTLSPQPVGMIFSETTGFIEWTPTNGQLGSGLMTLTVRDGGEDGSMPQSTEFEIIVAEVNNQVRLDDVPNANATEDQLFEYQAIAVDADDSQSQLVWTLQNEPVGMTAIGGLIQWTPLEGVSNSGQVTLTVEDGGENGTVPVSDTFMISVTQVNDPPVISSTALSTGLEDNLYSYQLVVDDPDDSDYRNDLDFELNGAPDGMEVSPTGLITWLPPEGPQLYEGIQVIARDGGEDGVEPAMQTFSVDIGLFNSAPRIESRAPTSATEDIEYRYQVDAQDIDDPNNGADLRFELDNAPEGMMINATGLILWSPPNGILDSGDVTVSVRDGGEDAAQPASEVFSVTVTPVNDAPVIDSTAPTAVIERNLYAYQVMVTDPDDENDGSGALNYALENAPEGMTVSSQGLIAWTPPEGTRTSGAITLRVVDGGEDGAAAAVQTFTIEVIEFNTPPLITSTAPTAATEDMPYRYQLVIADIDDPNDGSGALAIELLDAPEGMTISDTGLISWTPLEGVTSSGAVTAVVTDGGEDSAAPARQQFTVAVRQVNDAPEIISTAAITVIEDDVYRYVLEVEDPDDSNNGVDLTYSLSNAPEGMRISSRGVITWQTNENSPPSSSIMVSVADGGEDGAVPATEAFTLVVNFDEDGDGIRNDDDNCRQTPNADQANNDADAQGDACDTDDDNDGIDDDFERDNALDPFDPDDASEDPDGDGRTNLDEFLSGSNPNLDDSPPVITTPQNVRLSATGFETYVDLGEAVATDSLSGPLEVNSDRASGRFQSGRHFVTWTAVDAEGNVSETVQIVDVIPQLSVERAQLAEEGQRVEVKFSLSGEPVRYPVSFNYRVSGTASEEDHNLRSGSFVLTQREGVLQFTVLNDDVADAMETLVLTLSDPSNAVLSPSSEHLLTIIDANTPPAVSLVVQQDGVPGLIVSRNGGDVVIDSQVSDPNVDEVFEYDWSGSDNRLTSTAGLLDQRFVFDPVDLAPGIYKVSLQVADGRGGLARDYVLLQVKEDAGIDSNSNGIDDELEQGGAPFAIQGDEDGDFIYTEAGLRIAMGQTATFADADGVRISMEELARFGDDGAAAVTDTDFSFSGGLFDFTVTGLSQVGASIVVVLPQTAALPANASYRKFIDERWQDFVVDDNNSVGSALSEGGACPSPRSVDYEPGLIEGYDCIALLIQDGGPNDADGQANGVVRDPGGAGVSPTSSTAGNARGGSSSSDSGGGATSVVQLGLLFLIMLTINATLRGSRRRILAHNTVSKKQNNGRIDARQNSF